MNIDNIKEIMKFIGKHSLREIETGLLLYEFTDLVADSLTYDDVNKMYDLFKNNDCFIDEGLRDNIHEEFNNRNLEKEQEEELEK